MVDLIRFFLFAISIAAFIKTTQYLYRYYVAHKAHSKRIAQEMALPPLDVLEQAKWKPVDTEFVQLSQQELAQKIRENLKTQSQLRE